MDGASVPGVPASPTGPRIASSSSGDSRGSSSSSGSSSNADRGRKQSFNYVAKSLLAGGIAGCVAKTAISPLDRVKILFQAGSPQFKDLQGSLGFRALGHIYRLEGVRGLFRGNSATLARIFPYAALQYMSYEQIKLLLNTEDDEKAYTRLVAGSLAGTISVFGTYPLDLMRARIAYEVQQRPRPLLRAMVDTFRLHGGWIALYKGFVPTVLGIVPYAGVSFFTYDTLKATVIAWQRSRPPVPSRGIHALHADSDTQLHAVANPNHISASIRLLLGSVAGATAQTVAYPLDVVRRRMQVHGLQGTDKQEYRSMMTAVRHIFAQGGVRGFYVGLTINYVKVAPAVGLSFVTYEYMKKLLDI